MPLSLHLSISGLSTGLHCYTPDTHLSRSSRVNSPPLCCTCILSPVYGLSRQYHFHICQYQRTNLLSFHKVFQVLLYTDKIVRFCINDCTYYFILTGNGINGNYTAFKVECLYQQGDCLYSVAFIACLFLAKGNAIG